MTDKFSKAFDDIPISISQDFSTAFDDIEVLPAQDFSKAFEDVKVGKPQKVSPIESRKKSIKAITETPGYVPAGDEQALTDEEISQQLSIADIAQRPLEFVSSPFEAIDKFVWSGGNIGEAIKPLHQWARPIGVEREEGPTPQSVLGIKNPLLGLAVNIVAQPSNIFLSKGFQNIIRGISGLEKAQQIRLATKVSNLADVMPERFITPTLTAKGKPSTLRYAAKEVEEGVGTLKNVPAVIDKPLKPINLFEFKLQQNIPKQIKSENLVAKGLSEKQIGKPLRLQVLQGEEEGEKLFRLNDKSGKTYVEVGLKGDLENGVLQLNWINIDKRGIDVSKTRPERLGKQVEPIKGAYKEIHKNIEDYASNMGYKKIGLVESEGRVDILSGMGFEHVKLDDLGKVPYTMYKRIGQNIAFEAPDFLEKNRSLKTFQRFGQDGAKNLLQIYQDADRRSMFFDLTKDGKLTFFDRLCNPVAKFDNVKDAEKFIQGIKPSMSDYWIVKQKQFKNADDLYRLASDFYYNKALEDARKIVPEYPVGAGVGRREAIVPGLKISTKTGVTEEKIAGGTKGIEKEIETFRDNLELFDVGQGEVVGVSGNVPIRESLANNLSVIRDQTEDFYSRIITGKSWIMPALHYMERHGKEALETFYRRIKIAEKREAVEKILIKREVKELTKGMSNKELEQLGNFFIAKSDNGLETLRKHKQIIPTIEELNGRQIALHDFVKTKFDEYFKRTNEARLFVGKEPLPYVEDYFTFFRNYDELSKQGYHLGDNAEIFDHIMQYLHRNAPPFPHEIQRTGGTILLENNTKDVFLKYADNVIHYIHNAPAIGINRKLLEPFKVGEKTVSIKDNAPFFYAWTNRWLDNIAGDTKSSWPTWVERGINKLNKNVVSAFIDFNLRVGVIQPTALVQSFAKLGPKYFSHGLVEYFKDIKSTDAITKSKVLSGAQYEQGLDVAWKMVREPGYFTKLVETVFGTQITPMRKVSRVYQGGEEGIRLAGKKLTTFLDFQSRLITWKGAYGKAKILLKLGEEAAINFADDTVIRTQGSGRISDLSQVQRTDLGKTLLTLQTFVVNNWSFLAKDVVGMGNPNVKTKEAFGNIFRYILGATAVNIFFEDILKTYSPFPTPIRAYIKQRKKGTSVPMSLLVGSAKELAELAPGPGGAIRYGSSPFGPLSEMGMAAQRKIAGKPEYKSVEQILATLFGVPGTSQFVKIQKGSEANAGLLESILGKKEKEERAITRGVRK